MGCIDEQAAEVGSHQILVIMAKKAAAKKKAAPKKKAAAKKKAAPKKKAAAKKKK